MREPGYTPTLAGMDDDDIEWELNKMDGMDPFGEPRPAGRPLNPTYRPADPAMVARIYRLMGRPYDASLIPERERHYLNGGWDNRDEDGYRAENPVRKMPDFGARSGVRTPDTLLPGFGPQQGGAKGPYWSIDPLAKGRRPGWGTEGGPADNVRTMEYRYGRDGTGFPGHRSVRNAMGYGAGGNGATTGVQAVSHNMPGGDGEGVARAGVGGKVLGPVVDMVINAFDADEFGKEVEAEALRNGDSKALAKQKGAEARQKYYVYLTSVTGVATWTGTKNILAGAGVETVGAAAGTYAMKPWIKKRVLGRTEDDYKKENIEPPDFGVD